jgi:hypothetical protein
MFTAPRQKCVPEPPPLPVFVRAVHALSICRPPLVIELAEWLKVSWPPALSSLAVKLFRALLVSTGFIKE